MSKKTIIKSHKKPKQYEEELRSVKLMRKTIYEIQSYALNHGGHDYEAAHKLIEKGLEKK